MTDLAKLWGDLASTAMLLDPEDIRATILATEGDDGLRAGGYEPIGSSQGPGDSVASSVADRLDNGRRAMDARTHPDVDALKRAERHFITAVAEVSRRCMSAPPCTTWDDAVQDAHLMHELGTITAAVDVKVRLSYPIENVRKALERVQEIHDRHCPHKATKADRLLTQDICLPHARIGEDRDRYGALRVCQGCYDMMRRAGLDPHSDHKDPDLWPSTEMLHAQRDMEVSGKRLDYQRARSAWLLSLPVRQQSA